jgi:four helix bundle protein
MKNLRHHSLIAWQRADDLFIKVHKLVTTRFPAIERFELASQTRRAAYSIPANIVEGFARRYRRMRLHFLTIAEGSLAELGYCLHPAHRLGSVLKHFRSLSAISTVLAPRSPASSARRG